MYQLEEYVRRSFVFWTYMIAPISTYVCGGFFVWSGVYFMRFNDSLLGTAFQLTWFLRLNAILGCIAILIDVVQVLHMQSGWLPLFFATGSGILWPTCFYINKSGEQPGTGQPATRPESKSEGGDKPQPDAEGHSR
jgi:hypothetical protein